jgi:hypothetical protein
VRPGPPSGAHALFSGGVDLEPLGEKMSVLTDMDRVVEDSLGDLYEDYLHAAVDKPLDLGRFIYVKIRRHFPDHIGEEVWWDHVKQYIHVWMFLPDDKIVRCVFPEEMFAYSRLLLVEKVNELIKAIEWEVEHWS